MNVARNPLGRMLLAGFVCGSYAIAIMAVGHGIAPVGLLLVIGEAEEFERGQLFGWLGLGLMVASVIHDKAFRLVAPPAMLCLATSMTMFVCLADVWIITAGTALPFLGAVAVTAWCLWRWSRSPSESLTH